jgi:hypothetical protein
MKKILFPIILITSFSAAQVPAGYYDGTTGAYRLQTEV